MKVLKEGDLIVLDPPSTIFENAIWGDLIKSSPFQNLKKVEWPPPYYKILESNMPFCPQSTHYKKIPIQKPFQSSNCMSLLILNFTPTGIYQFFGKKIH